VGGPPRLKSFVSISYGCDKFCAFCIVPITRGKERSRPADEIVLEVERLASLGTREITLLGQTVNSYGKFLDESCSFAELLARLDAVEGIERIRFTSPYPKDFDDEAIQAIASLPAVWATTCFWKGCVAAIRSNRIGMSCGNCAILFPILH